MALNQVFAVVIDIRMGQQAQRAPKQLNETAAAAQNASNQFNKAKNAVGQLAGAFTGLVAARAVVGVLKGVLEPAMEFQLALRRIATLTGAAGGALNKFAEEAKRVASITPYGPTAMLETLLQLQRATGSSEAALKALEATATLANASFGAMNIKEATTMMATMIRSFGLSGAEAEDAAERIFAASKVAGLGIEEYSKVMGRLSVANTAGGQSFDEIVTAFSLINRQLNSPLRAATQLMAMTGRLQRGHTQDILGGLGVSVTDSVGNIRRIRDIMVDLAKVYMTSTVSVRNSIEASFGRRGGEPILVMLNQLTGAYRNQRGEIKTLGEVYDAFDQARVGSAGNLRKASLDAMATVSGMFQLMKEKFELLRKAIGTPLLAPFGALVQVLGAFIHGVTAVLEHPLGQWLLRVVGGAIALKAAIWALTAAKYALSAIMTVVAGNVGPMFSSQLAQATDATGKLTKGARVARVALSAMWGGVTVGLALLPQLVDWLFKAGDNMAAMVKAGKELPWYFKAVDFWARNAVPQWDKLKNTTVQHNKQLELAVAHTKEMYHGLNLASEEMKKLNQTATRMAKFTFAEIKAAPFRALEQQIAASQGRLARQGDKNIAASGLRAAARAREIMALASERPLRKKELEERTRAFEYMGIVGRYLQQKTGLVSKGALKSFGEDVTTQSALENTEESRYATGLLARAAGGYPAYDSPIPGFSPAKGYGGAEDTVMRKQRPWLQSPALEAIARSSEKAAQQSSELNQLMHILNDTGRSLLRRLDTGIKTESASGGQSDPMGGQSSSYPAWSR